ncbi:MAG: HK97 family phage prohead protease [Methanosarcinales archaeon]
MKDEMRHYTSTESFSILKAKDDGEFVIGGYASVPIEDRQHEIITKAALEKDFERFMSSALYRNVNLLHSNVQVGHVIDSYEDGDGNVWRTQIDDKGLFVLASIRNDIQKAQEVRDLIRKGVIKAYSIGGQPLDWTYTLKAGRPVRLITGIEIHEISLASEPVNPETYFEVLKSMEAGNMADEEKTFEEIMLEKMENLSKSVLTTESLQEALNPLQERMSQFEEVTKNITSRLDGLQKSIEELQKQKDKYPEPEEKEEEKKADKDEKYPEPYPEKEKANDKDKYPEPYPEKEKKADDDKYPKPEVEEKKAPPTIDEVMEKVRAGQSLTEEEKKVLEEARTKKQAGGSALYPSPEEEETKVKKAKKAVDTVTGTTPWIEVHKVAKQFRPY